MTSPEPLKPSAPAPRRRRTWIIAVSFILVMAVLAGRTFTLRKAEEQLRVAGFEILSERPILAHIAFDWRRAFDPEIWEDRKIIEVGDDKCAQLRNLDDLSDALRRVQPTEINLVNCTALENVDGLKGVSGLRRLSIVGCPELRSMSGIGGLLAIDYLEIHDCAKLTDADGLEGLLTIEYLHISACPSLQNVTALHRLSQFTKLRYLMLQGRSELKNADDFKALSGLELVELWDCDALENVDGLKSLPFLNFVTLGRCTKLSSESVAALRAAHPNSAIEGP